MRRPRIVNTCLLILALGLLTGIFFSNAVHGQGEASQRSNKVFRIDSLASVYIDKTNALTIDDITKASFQDQFQKSPGNFTFGYLRDAIWLKVVTTVNAPDAEWYLEIPAPFIDYVDFYQKSETGQWVHTSSGYYRPFSTRAVPHTGHALAIKHTKEGKSTIYIRITGTSPKTFPLFLIEKEYFNEKVRTEDFGYGIFFGILIVMFFFNLFIFLSLRNINYLLYISTIVCTFLIFAAASGYGGMYLWPNTPIMNYYAGRLSLPLQGVMLSIFTIRFLELRMYSKRMFYAVGLLIPLSIVAAILIMTGTMYSAGNNLISVATVTYMIAGIVSAARGNRTAIYFIAAWTIYLFGGLLLTLRNNGVFEFNFWTTHFVEIGAAAETIFIAFALADKYRRLRMEKEEAQRLALKIQQEATDRLEFKVRDRTEKLTEAYEELQQTHEKNLLQTRMIEDKNAELDAFFYRISHDLKGPISSLKGLSTLAKMDVKDPVALEYFEKQFQQVERLSHVITGLINLTKLKHSDLERENINFAALVDECIQSFSSLPNKSRTNFIKEIDPDFKFFSQWTLINAIMQNLIENSIKYAQRNSPYVKISVISDEQWVTITVEDNGQGIPAEHQPRIFDMFYRATENATGTGLGLYIVKRSVDRLKGTISLTSKEGSGSIFVVKLPKLDMEA